ncbi:unnamed protein product [Prunus armeniaca]
MPRIDSKRLPLRLKRSCTDVLSPSLVYGYECVMSFCHWLLSLCFQMATLLQNNGFKFSGLSRLFILHNFADSMADIVTEEWIQIQRLEQALHITQILTFDNALLFAERKKKKKDSSPPPVA